MLRALKIVGVVVGLLSFGLGFLAADRAAIPGVPVRWDDQKRVFGSAGGATHCMALGGSILYCFGSGGGGGSPCGGCGCRLTLFPSGTGDLLTQVNMCANDPYCTIDQIIPGKCSGGT